MNKSLEKLKSVRVGKLHFAVHAGAQPQDLKTVNAAKRLSRHLGGAGFVRAVATTDEAKAIQREWQELQERAA